jgi:predicted ATPase
LHGLCTPGRVGHPQVVPAVKLRLLGGFAAAVESRPLERGAWRLGKARDLVKLLALAEGRRLHREQAMEALWPGRDPASAANNLYQAVHAARRALGPSAIQVHDELLSLDAGIEVDVDEFEQTAAAALHADTPAAYHAALSLYGGELLPENRYDDWAIERREELIELQERLVEGLARVGPPDSLRRLPAETSSFVGRERELAELDALLAGTRAITLTGPGGAGKTRLALQLARASERAFAGGAVFVELAAVESPSYVADAVAAALDVRPLPGQATTDAVLDFLGRRELLLLLDNCEHVLRAAAELAEGALRAAPGVKLLATSREPLRVAGEVVFRVPSLEAPSALQLFVERAAQASPGFELDEANGAVTRICARLDGLPLALELAAGRVAALGTAAVVERLDDRFRLLLGGEQTLEATLDWSHDLLDGDEQTLFRRLGAFAGGFDLAAAESVCEVDAGVLARLVEKSLVTPEELGAERRFRLLETIRAYARDRLEEAGETAEVARRHARWALALAAREAGSPRLDFDAANLRSAGDQLLTEAPEDALRLCLALAPFWLRRIDLDEGRRRFADALAAAPQRTPLRAEALLAAAAVDFRSGRLGTTSTLVEQSLSLAVEIGAAATELRALLFLGGLAVGLDDGETARRWFERALGVARRESVPAIEAICIYSLGVAEWKLGDLAAAEGLVAEAVEALRRLGASPEVVPAPINIAEMRLEGPSDRPSLRFVFEETLQPFVEVSAENALGYTLVNQAGVARARGDAERASTLLDEAGTVFVRTGEARGEADVLVRRGYLRLAEGSVGKAREDLERALDLRNRLSDRRAIGLVLTALGLVEIAAGDHARAGELITQATDLFRRAGDRWGLTAALWRSADLAFARERPGDAAAALEEALALLVETGRQRWIDMTRAALAEANALRGAD